MRVTLLVEAADGNYLERNERLVSYDGDICDVACGYRLQ